MCEVAYAGFSLLASVLGYDSRCLNAGLDFCGGCLPKDIRAFMACAGELGANQVRTFLAERDSVNIRCFTRMVELEIGRAHV